MSHKESRYDNCMVDMKQKLFTFKRQLDEQHKSRSFDLERQYKSQIATLDKAIVEKDKEFGRLFSSPLRYKNEIKDLRNTISFAKKTIKTLDDIIFAKDRIIIAYSEG